MSQVGPRGVISYLASPNAAKHIEWIVSALGAELESKMPVHDKPNKVMHAVLKINEGGTLYIADNFHDPAPQGKGEAELVTLHLNVPNSQEVWDKAIEHGAKSLMPLDNQSWGAKYGVFVDPYGFKWSVHENTGPVAATAAAKGSPKKRPAEPKSPNKTSSPSPKRQKTG
eukprot:TRINITY_DN1243_c0_g1_i1.p1 TRINITY_DN1243_c0_g1~~TRINITY_DN1243_c0_g1_i1.p1  ORF type:complete len:170 (+),score=35.11 TRINITY_DN1243_c0_g1_i1:49-558(+)